MNVIFGLDLDDYTSPRPITAAGPQHAAEEHNRTDGQCFPHGSTSIVTVISLPADG